MKLSASPNVRLIRSFSLAVLTQTTTGDLSFHMKPRRVAVNDLMQTGYVYYCTQPTGRNFHPDFKPELTPKEMLELGVFGGKYMTDCTSEFPASWFKHAKLCHERHDPN